jgi:hypothetical protein
MTDAMNGAERIAAERKRQVEARCWTPEHDDDHTGGELIQAGVAYALAATPDAPLSDDMPVELGQGWWPWDDHWKPSNPIRNLEKAGALIAAEIDRLLRKTP